MEFWHGNRINGEFEREIPPLALEFWGSSYGDKQLRGSDWPLERSLRAFLTDPAGFNSSWTDESDTTGFGALLERVRQLRPRLTTAEVDMSAPRSFPPVASVNSGPGGIS